jgi:LysM repeat protein
MHRTSPSRLILIFAALIIMVLATGCFQDAGQGLQATSVAQSVATFTPFATLEPSPTPEVLETDESTAEVFPTLTETPQDIAQLPTLSETPTPDTFGSVNGSNPQQEGDAPALTATAIIASATARYIQTELALTQLPPFASPTPDIIFPTLTPTTDPNFGQGGGPTGPIVTGTDCVHEVRVGDNLFRLSLYYGLTIDQIAQRNGITNINLIIFRQKLVIPGCGTTGNPPPPTTVPGPGPGPNPGRSYVVKQGDNLFRISLSYGVPISAIAAANGIANINLIYVGQVLYIP